MEHRSPQRADPAYPLGLPSGRAERYPYPKGYPLGLGRRKTLTQLRALGKPSSVFWARGYAPLLLRCNGDLLNFKSLLRYIKEDIKAIQLIR